MGSPRAPIDIQIDAVHITCCSIVSQKQKGSDHLCRFGCSTRKRNRPINDIVADAPTEVLR